MAPSRSLAARFYGSDTSNTKVTPLIIGGFVLAVIILVLACIWLVLRHLRHRRACQGPALLPVGAGLRSPISPISEKGYEPDSPPARKPTFKGNQFSRAQLTQSIVLPDRATVRPDATPDEIVAHHAALGTLPQPFRFSMGPSPPPGLATPPRAARRASLAASISITFDPAPDVNTDLSALAASLALPPPPSPTRSSVDRRSWRSSIFRIARGSFAPSARSSLSSMRSLSVSSAAVAAGEPQERKVRQTFNPVLPDELVLALGESLLVLQTFDDGWCIVGRAAGASSIFAAAHAAAAPAAGPFARKPDPELAAAGLADGAEIGACPGWVFVKPAKGLRAERPMRSSSLRVALDLNQPGAPRGECVSWTNFML